MRSYEAKNSLLEMASYFCGDGYLFDGIVYSSFKSKKTGVLMQSTSCPFLHQDKSTNKKPRSVVYKLREIFVTGWNACLSSNIVQSVG